MFGWRSLAPFGLVLAALLGGQGQPAAQEASAEWQALVKAAKAEGKVQVILSGQVPLLLRQAMPEFEKKYGIKVEFQTGGGAQHIQRIRAERQLGRYTVDVWMGGVQPPLGTLYQTKELDPIDELLMDADVKDKTKWYRGTHHYCDPEGRYILAWGASPSHVVIYNTNLVKPEEIRSYADLLDPKWSGKIVTWVPQAAGATGTSIPMLLNPKLGEPWFRKWSKQNLTIVKDARQGAEWVAVGKFSIGMFGLGTQARDLSKQGFPIREFLPHPIAEGESLSSSAANIMVLKNPPNPNARKLFVNWALSKEAQALFIKYGQRIDSLRTDVPNDVIEAHYRIMPNAQYYATFSRNSPEYADAKVQADAIEKLRAIMREAGHR